MGWRDTGVAGWHDEPAQHAPAWRGCRLRNHPHADRPSRLSQGPPADGLLRRRPRTCGLLVGPGQPGRKCAKRCAIAIWRSSRRTPATRLPKRPPVRGYDGRSAARSCRWLSTHRADPQPPRHAGRRLPPRKCRRIPPASWAVLRRRFRDGPHERLGLLDRLVIESCDDQPLDILIDGEPASSAIAPNSQWLNAPSIC